MKDKTPAVNPGEQTPEVSAGEQIALRYINPNYTIPGVPSRDLTVTEAQRLIGRITEAQTNSRVIIYQEVN